VSNAAELLKRRSQSIKRAKKEMMNNEQEWEQRKAEMEFNIANRPLLVEQGILIPHLSHV